MYDQGMATGMATGMMGGPAARMWIFNPVAFSSFAGAVTDCEDFISRMVSCSYNGMG